jgi:hypothetical protein
LLEKQSKVMADATLSETSLLTNLNDSCLSLFHSLDYLRPRGKPSVDISHSGNVSSRMIRGGHASTLF